MNRWLCVMTMALLAPTLPGRAETPAPAAALDPLVLERARDIPERDPFAFTAAMLPQAQDSQFTPYGGQVSVPPMRLQGLVRRAGEPALALLEIQGLGVFLVRNGETISLSNAGDSTVIKIKKVEHASLEVEVGTLGQVVVVR